jgi:dephospho-CoA kinase
MIKIAVVGKLGSGKNLFLDVAKKFYPELQLIEAKFAQPIYDAMSNVQKSVEVEEHKDGKLLQLIGNHYRQEYFQDFWVERFFKKRQSNNHIITDVRFPNELLAAIENGYKTVKIERRVELRINNLGNRDIHHVSETALDTVSNNVYDFTINNNGSLELFEGAVISIIQRIKDTQ